MCRYPRRPEENVEFPSSGFEGSCQLLHVHVGNGTLVFLKGSHVFNYLDIFLAIEPCYLAYLLYHTDETCFKLIYYYDLCFRYCSERNLPNWILCTMCSCLWLLCVFSSTPVHAFTCVPVTDLNSNPNVYKAGTLPTELSPQPLKWTFIAIFIVMHYYHKLRNCSVNYMWLQMAPANVKLFSVVTCLLIHSQFWKKALSIFPYSFFYSKVVFISSCYHFLDDTYKIKSPSKVRWVHTNQ